MEEDMVERFAAASGGGDEYTQVLPRRLLANELVEALGPQRRIGVFGRPFGRRDAGGISGHGSLIGSSVAKQSSRRHCIAAAARFRTGRPCSPQVWFFISSR